MFPLRVLSAPPSGELFFVFGVRGVKLHQMTTRHPRMKDTRQRPNTTDEAYPAKVQAARAIHERARQFRGRFLNSIAVIDHEICQFLTEYFCKSDDKKRELFFTDIAARMSSEGRRVLLTNIVKQDYPEIWEEYKSLIQDLKQYQEFRNKLAHSMIDVSDAALARPLKDGIGFIQWKDAHPITEEEFNDWDARAATSYGILCDLKGMVQAGR
jgi:hypothetical protein